MSEQRSPPSSFDDLATYYGWALAHTGAHLFGSLTLTALGMFCARALKL